MTDLAPNERTLSAPPLPDTLARLAALLPERVRAEMGEDDGTDPWVFQYLVRRRGWEAVWWGGDLPVTLDLAPLEYALREECAARDYAWEVRGNPGAQLFYASVFNGKEFTEKVCADTPAQALALAFIQTLETP